jgi:transcriptional regulator with XRE-family HTH domain
MTQQELAKAIGISDGHLSQVLSGRYEPGKSLARKMGQFAGREWTDFLTMTPDEIRQALMDAAAKPVSNDR